MSAGHIGCIVTPKQRNPFNPAWDVIADNGCFSAKWTEGDWLRWLGTVPATVRFAVCPDVYDPTGAPCHDATVDRWHQYAPLIREHGLTPAFVCQMGATPDNVPEDAPVLFIGGSTEFKLGPGADAIAARYRHDRWLHMGRVNSLKRFRVARSMGCHSADGTFLTFGPDTNLPKLLGWIRDQEQAPMLWEMTA